MIRIYELRHGDQVRYIGRTKRRLSQRLYVHRTAARHGKASPVALWMRDVGYDVTIHLIEECDNDALGRDLEAHWMDRRRAEGADLLNIRMTNAPKAEYATTHCPAGHAYEPDNAYICAGGKRKCIICAKAKAAARIVCGLCDRRADDPAVKSCTHGDCGLSERRAA